jgi:excisionase family DNA binding protein
MSEQRLLTVREVAERLRSSPETVRRWLRQGKLRGFRLGGTKLGYRVTESELDQIPVPTQRVENGGPGSGP